jgi:hypothetical protein
MIICQKVTSAIVGDVRPIMVFVTNPATYRRNLVRKNALTAMLIILLIVAGFLLVYILSLHEGAGFKWLAKGDLASIIKFFVMIVVLLIWSVVGLLFWLPLLTRITAVYCAIIIAYTFSGQDTSGAGKILDKAVTFYISGFSRILKSVWEKSDEEAVTLHVEWGKLFAQVIYTIFFWGSIGALFYFHERIPL